MGQRPEDRALPGPRPARLLHGAATRRPTAARGPHLHLGRLHRDRPPRALVGARRPARVAGRGADARRGDADLPRPGRADRRLLPGDRRARERDRRARGRRSSPTRGASTSRRSYRLKQDVRELHRLTPAQHEQFKSAHEFILALDGLTKGTRPYLRDIGDHLVQIAGEFQRQLDDLLGAHPDLLQRELRPAQRGRHAADDRRHDLRRLHRRDRLLRPELRLAGGATSTPGTTSCSSASARLVVPTVILLTLFWVKRRRLVLRAA